MKTTISKLKYVLFLFVIIGFVSCEGPIGPSGLDGIDGVDGNDGNDGNANVVTVSLMEPDITWVAGNYLNRPANVFVLDTGVVNQDIIDHGTVLGYCHFVIETWDEWLILPYHWENTLGNTNNIVFTYNLNEINLYAYTTAGVWDPSTLIPEYRFLLITDNTVTKTVSGEQAIYDELEEAGVDINNYYEVMDYYGLEY